MVILSSFKYNPGQHIAGLRLLDYSDFVKSDKDADVC